MRTLIVTSFAENSRATWLRPHFSSIKNISYLTLCDRQDTFRPQAVSSFLRKYGEDSICDEHNAIQRLQNEAKYALSSGNPELPLVVDVSCMSRRQMGYVMAAIRDIAAVIIPIRLQLIYCLAKFTRPPENPHIYNRRVAPVHPAFSGWTTSPGLPLEVVVSLGYERGKAAGAVEYLEPRKKWVFIPNSPDDRFLKNVTQHNKDLIAATSSSQLFYDVLSPVDTYYTLLSLVHGLSKTCRPVLLPFGPKLFFSLALLVAMCMDQVSVWHVDSEELPTRQYPSNHSTSMECLISSTNRILEVEQ